MSCDLDQPMSMQVHSYILSYPILYNTFCVIGIVPRSNLPACCWRPKISSVQLRIFLKYSSISIFKIMSRPPLPYKKSSDLFLAKNHISIGFTVSEKKSLPGGLDHTVCWCCSLGSGRHFGPRRRAHSGPIELLPVRHQTPTSPHYNTILLML